MDHFHPSRDSSLKTVGTAIRGYHTLRVEYTGVITGRGKRNWQELFILDKERDRFTSLSRSAYLLGL